MEYVEHLAWLLFLKFFDEQEGIFEQEAAIAGRKYKRVIDKDYRWSDWVPKAIGEKTGENGRRKTPEWNGDRLMQIVRGEIIPYMGSLSGSPERDVIGGLFSARNVVVCASPYNLKDVLEIVDNIDFKNPDDIHTVSHVYEDLLRKLGNENKMAGEFYTPRSIIRFIVEVIAPQIGETVYDPFCGSCGFLVEAFEYMKTQEKTTKDHQVLQRKTFVGQEKKALPALLGAMNLILHGVLVPEVRRRNTLEENVISAVSERFDVVLTNPPFGGKENAQIQQNFPVKSNATELLALEHIVKKLKPGRNARCGVVVPEGTLFRSGAFAVVKEMMLNDFDLFMIVSLPPGAFAPYSDVKTALMFFKRSGSSSKVLYHEVPLPEGLKKFSKVNPISDENFAEARRVKFLLNQFDQVNIPTEKLNASSWLVESEILAEKEFDFSARNPNKGEDEILPHPSKLTSRILKNQSELHEIIERLHKIVSSEEGKR
jgi:type I restriction enzyme M protein